MDKSHTEGFVLRRTISDPYLPHPKTSYYCGTQYWWSEKIDEASIRAASTLKGAATRQRKKFSKSHKQVSFGIVAVKRVSEEVHAVPL